jgi:hypothetical protein
MADTKSDILPWISWTLQGIPFWVGYQKARDRSSRLKEHVLVDELHKLLNGNRPDGIGVRLEYPFWKITKKIPRSDRRKVDLVIREPYTTQSGKTSHRITTIFEVKLATATDRAIDIDLRRLSILKQARPDCRAFLLVASQRCMPPRFVTSTGKFFTRRLPVPQGAGSYSVVRLYKAAPAFDAREKANYACLIEVFWS